MSDKLSAEELAGIRERVEAATCGPWEADWCGKCDGWHFEGPPEIGGTGILVQLRDGAEQIEDMQFMAHARTDVPRLLSHIEAVEAENARLRTALEHIELGEGPFSRDQLTHAENCITAMQGVARAALSETPND